MPIHSGYAIGTRGQLQRASNPAMRSACRIRRCSIATWSEKARASHRADRRRGMADSPLANEGLSAFRRAYRWLNLTLVQHGVWPLLVVVFGAPAVPVALTPLPWYWARLAAPVLATLLALAYLAQRPQGLPSDRAQRTAEATSERDRRLREQATILIVGVTTAVAILRVLQGPFIPVLKLEAFGRSGHGRVSGDQLRCGGTGGRGRCGSDAAHCVVWSLLGTARSFSRRGVARGGEFGAFVRRWRRGWAGTRRGLIRSAALARWVSCRYRPAVPHRLSGAWLSGLSDATPDRERFEGTARTNGSRARYARPGG